MAHTERIAERESLLEAAEKIGPTLERHADRAEADRHLPPESIDALESAGVFRMMWPRELGGFEADPVTQFEVIERLAYHDPSAAWCGFIGAGSSAFVGANVPEKGLAEIRASLDGMSRSDWVRIAGSPQPVGRARAVEGGYRLSGRWGWLSGVHHSDWVFVGAALVDDEASEPKMTEYGIPEALSFVLPTSEVEIEDTWQTAGLRGTGSAHVTVEDIFVPADRTFGFPFNEPVRGGALFRLPTLGFFGPAFAGFPQGLGRRALDEIAALAKSKTRVLAGRVLSERGAFQRDLGRAHDRLRAARALLIEELSRLWEGLHAGRTSEPLASAELLSAFTFNAEAGLQAAETAFRYAGGDSVFSSSVFQRLLRDMRVADQHILIGEYNTENLGRTLLDLAQTRSA